MKTRFKDINDLITLECVLNPGLEDTQNIQLLIQKELFEINYNGKAKINFKHSVYQLFCLKQKTIYPLERSGVINYSFSVNLISRKRQKSTVQQLRTKSKNLLKISEKGDLRMMLASINLDIILLARNY